MNIQLVKINPSFKLVKVGQVGFKALSEELSRNDALCCTIWHYIALCSTI
jgi:hypothetical protein